MLMSHEIVSKKSCGEDGVKVTKVVRNVCDISNTLWH